MPKHRALKVVAGIAISFLGLVAAIIFLFKAKMISLEVAILMIVALFGLYLGFGVLTAVYRLVNKLE